MSGIGRLMIVAVSMVYICCPQVVLAAQSARAVNTNGYIAGYKIYDSNLNGNVREGSEPALAGWYIQLVNLETGEVLITQTNEMGSYRFQNLAAGTYTVSEVLPLGGAPWVQTAPLDIHTPKFTASGGVYTVTLLSVNGRVQHANLNFGNVCLNGGGGNTPGFWSNKNGQALISLDDINVLNGLDPYSTFTSYPKGPEGFPPFSTDLTNGEPLSGRDQINEYLLDRNAEDMRYALAGQLLAMELNTLEFVSGDSNFVDPASFVFVGTNAFDPAGPCFLGSPFFMTVSDLMSNAVCAWNLGDGTVANPDHRAVQEYYKNALDAANNNTNFVQAAPCEAIYTDEQLAQIK